MWYINIKEFKFWDGYVLLQVAEHCEVSTNGTSLYVDGTAIKNTRYAHFQINGGKSIRRDELIDDIVATGKLKEK